MFPGRVTNEVVNGARRTGVQSIGFRERNNAGNEEKETRITDGIEGEDRQLGKHDGYDVEESRKERCCIIASSSLTSFDCSDEQ